MSSNLFIGFFPELFLSFCVLFSLIYNSFVANSLVLNFPLIDRQVFNQTIFFLLLVFLLCLNTCYIYINSSSLFIIDFPTMLVKCVVVVSIAVVLCLGRPFVENDQINSFEFYTIVLLASLALTLLASSYDLISFYVSLEMLSLCLYVMATFKKGSVYSSEAGLKYFILGSITSGIILFGCVLIYGVTGTTSFSEISLLYSVSNQLPDISYPFYFGLVFLLIGFFFKLGAVPFHIWLPDVYEGSPYVSTVFFVLVPKIVYFLVLCRLCFFSFLSFFSFIQPILFCIGLASVVVASTTALNQKRIKRLLVFSSVSHVGFMLLAVSAGGSLGLSSLIHYLLLYFVNNMTIWGLLCIFKGYKSDSVHLTDFSGIFSFNMPIVLCFIVVFFSLAGIPPLSGFLMKYLVFVSAYNSFVFEISSLVLVSSAIGAFYYLRAIKIITTEVSGSNTILSTAIPLVSFNATSTVVALGFLIIIIYMYDSFLITLLSFKFSMLLA